MTASSILIAIPARLSATRLPNKPLADIAGKPMIVRVMECAMRANQGEVIVAAGEMEIVEAVQKAGGKAVLTDPNLPSGTDRIFAALSALPKSYDIIVNVQGDLPTLDPALIARAVEILQATGSDISTLAARITREEEIHNPNVVKAIISGAGEEPYGRALYFTRTTAPHGAGGFLHHIGLYAYTQKALERFVSLPPSALEKREKLEQLRALEAGMSMVVGVVDTVPLGVDTAEDLERARNLHGLTS